LTLNFALITETLATHPPNLIMKIKIHNQKMTLTHMKPVHFLILKLDQNENFRSRKAITFNFIIKFQMIGGEHVSTEKLVSSQTSLFR
jgi:hypothetical protein